MSNHLKSVLFRHYTNILFALKMNKSANLKVKLDGKSSLIVCDLQAEDKDSFITKFEDLPTPIKSASDKKDYKVIKLMNGLTACLVSDKAPRDDLGIDSDCSSSASDNSDSEGSESDSADEDEGLCEIEDDVERVMKKVPPVEQKMAAAALCIGVGSFSDPKDIPGLAHFLEHMVFMGSEKFPAENDFDSFIKKGGGSDNASTDCETTVFYFECLEKHLFKALDKFAQFFIYPLMKKSAMTREREAIESEFQIALPKDSYRKEQLLCSLANPNSPVNKFSWGNLVTLRDNVTDDKLYEDVHNFRKRHYSAHRMTVAIQARLPLAELQQYVLDCFSNVPSNDLPPEDFADFTNNVFDTVEFKKMYYVKPTKDLCQVDLTWCLPSLLSKYKSKPHQYVSWLLGDEGKGSLLSYLKKKVWALALYCGNSESGIEHNSMYALFSVHLTLTSEGLAHVNEVIGAVFSYIKLMKDTGPDERMFKELQTIEDISFRFSVEETACDMVEDLAESMQFYPSEDYIAGSELFVEYDPEGICMVLDHLVPDKMNVAVTSNVVPEDIVFDKKEQWFGAEYTDREIPEDQLQIWREAEPLPEMSLPSENLFLTTDFRLLSKIEKLPDYPQKILDTPLVELWYRRDQKFELPTAYYNFYIITPFSVESASSLCKMEMLINLFAIQFSESAYPAQVAELLYSINTSDKGITIKVSGFNEKLPILVELISSHLKKINEDLTKEMFEAVKDKLSNHYYNQLIKPSTLAKEVRLHLLMDKYYTSTQKYTAIADITFEDMTTFCTEMFAQLFVKVLVQGNVEESVALEVVKKFVKSLNYSALNPKECPKFNILDMPEGEYCCRVQSFNNKDSNSIITNYYQSGPFALKNSVIIELIMMIIEEPLFDILRTKEQLGYNVSSTLRETFGILGYTITVNAQATKNTTQHVDRRIESFIAEMGRLLKKMTDKKLNQIKRDLIKMKQCADVVLKEEVDRNWSEIVVDDYMFDRLKREIEMIEIVKVVELRKWWENHNMFGSKANFKKLSVQVVGFDIKSTEGASSTKKPGKTCPKFQEIKKVKGKPKINFLTPSDSSLEKRAADYFISDLSEFKESFNYYPPSHAHT